MLAYLDNCATTKVYDEVNEIMTKVMLSDYGNPSSLHLKGVEAEKYIKETKTAIAKSLKVNEKEIIFTSGGTESNNLALIGCALANKRAGNHIITTSIEHPSVSACTQFLESVGFEITYLSVDGNGIVDLEELKNSIKDNTILVSVMYVNNEIGAVQPIERINEIIRQVKPSVLFHVDAIQAYGKYKIYPQKLGVDLLSVSGHKIHGPKGIGFLYVREKTKIKPVIYGGGQQNGMRSGTENVPAIAGLGVAVKKVYENFEENISHMRALKKAFIEGISVIEGTYVNGLSDDNSAPHVVSVSFEKVRSEVLLHMLEDKGIYVSAGSACSSNKPHVSATLKSIGVRSDLLESTIRFSFCADTTDEEIAYTVDVLKEIIPVLRKYTRK